MTGDAVKKKMAAPTAKRRIHPWSCNKAVCYCVLWIINCSEEMEDSLREIRGLSVKSSSCSEHLLIFWHRGVFLWFIAEINTN